MSQFCYTKKHSGVARVQVARFPVLQLPKNAGKAYETIRASPKLNGRTISNNDLCIAAHAKAKDLEFSRIQGRL